MTVGNTATVPQPTVGRGGVEAQVLAGALAMTLGGVTADFGDTITAGALTIQQVPGITSLTQAAIDAGAANPIFALSTTDTAIGAPQIWNVEFGGNLNGSTATLQFHYDPSTLPVGTDETQLVIWHYNSLTNQWEHSGPSDVDVADHIISFTTSSFSPFALGTLAVPEPSTLALGGEGLISLAVVAWRRRRGAARG